MIVAGVVLGSWRITRLLGEDRLLARPRHLLLEWAIRHKRMSIVDFVACPHCISVWVSAILVSVVAQLTSVPAPLAVFAVAAAVCSLITDFRPDHA